MHRILTSVAMAIALQTPCLALARQSDRSAHPPAFDQIRLVRTICFGMCPAYSITISGDGRVVYEGDRFVRKAGRARSRLSKAQLDELMRALQEVDYFSLRDTYTPVDGCAFGATDAPSAITTVTMGGRTKTIRHDLSCQDRPPDDGLFHTGLSFPQQLTRFEMFIDQITDSRQWVAMPASARHLPPQVGVQLAHAAERAQRDRSFALDAIARAR